MESINSLLIGIMFLIIALFIVVFLYFKLKKEIESKDAILIKAQEELENVSSFLNNYKQIDIDSENEFAKVIDQFKDQNWLVYRNVRWQWRDSGSRTNYMQQ